MKSLVARFLGRDTNTQWWKKSSAAQKKKINQHCLTPAQIKELDKRLKSIKLPERTLKAMPQFAQKHSLKALHYELFLFYGFVCLDGLLENQRFLNFRLLAFIMSALSQRFIRHNIDLRTVKLEISKFYKQFSKIYATNESFMWFINVHFLSHLPAFVALFGPLPVQNAYFTESDLGGLSSKVQTGTNVPQQVMNKAIVFQSIHTQCCVNLAKRSKPFLTNLASYLPKLVQNVPVKTKSYESTFVPTQNELELLNAVPSDTFVSLQRIRVEGKLICTREYNKTLATSTTNHCIKTVKNKYFIVDKIVQVNGTAMYLLCFEFLQCKKLKLYPDEARQQSLEFFYINTYKKLSSTLTCLNASDIAEFSLSTYVTVSNTNYLFDIFNRHF